MSVFLLTRRPGGNSLLPPGLRGELGGAVKAAGDWYDSMRHAALGRTDSLDIDTLTWNADRIAEIHKSAKAARSLIIDMMNEEKDEAGK